MSPIEMKIRLFAYAMDKLIVATAIAEIEKISISAIVKFIYLLFRSLNKFWKPLIARIAALRSLRLLRRY